MKINLDETEIQNALVEYITNQGIDLSHKNVEVTLVAGRGVNGHSAALDIQPEVAVKDAASDSCDHDDKEEVAGQQAIAFDFGQEE